MKRCPACKQVQPTSAFYRDLTKSGGLKSACKSCHKARMLAYHVANREAAKARQAAYRTSTPEKTKARKAVWYAANSERASARRAAWYAANRETARVSGAAYRAAHREETRARDAAYRAANPEKMAVNDHRRRARKRDALGSFTAAEFALIVKRQRGRCAECCDKAKLTRDHIIPLAAGGSNFAFNIQGLCHPCNVRKGARIAQDAQFSLFDRVV